MKINGFTVESFSREEYTANQTPEIVETEGEDILISGPNKSGKSLTFAAIAHALLGSESPLDVSVGSGSNITLHFTDDSRMIRGAPTNIYTVRTTESGETANREYTSKEAEAQLREHTGPTDLLATHFLSSESQLLPLESLTNEGRMEVIRAALNRPAQLELEQKRSELNELDEEQDELEDSLTPLSKDKSTLERQIGQFESQVSDWSEIVELADSGRFHEIKQELDERADIKNQLTDLSARKRGLNRKITSKKNELDEIERYENSVENIIAEALTEFVCPVCDGKVSTKAAKKRMGSGKCPFCNVDRAADQVKAHVREQKQEVEGRPGELTNEIVELKNERSQIETEISELESQMPAISELNSLAVGKLKEIESVDLLETEARDELEVVTERLDEAQQNLEMLESQIDDVNDQIQELIKSQENLKQEIEQLQTEAFEEAFDSFQQSFDSHFTSLGGDLGESSTVRLDPDTGKISLNSEDSSPRQYSRKSELSSSEVQLLNIAFVLAVNDHAVETGSMNWEVILLDEPFSNFDTSTTTNAIEYLHGIPQQVIMTSSSGEVPGTFPDSNILRLERSDTTQVPLEEYLTND